MDDREKLLMRRKREGVTADAGFVEPGQGNKPGKAFVIHFRPLWSGGPWEVKDDLGPFGLLPFSTPPTVITGFVRIDPETAENGDEK